MYDRQRFVSDGFVRFARVPTVLSFQGAGWAGSGRVSLDEVAPSRYEVGEFLLVDIAGGAPIRWVPGAPAALASPAGPIHIVAG